MNCQRKGCSLIATSKISSRASYCSFHARIHYARGTAARKGKKRSSFLWLENEFLITKFCPFCQCSLNPFKYWGRYGKRLNQPTLQHYKNGHMGVICHSCNIKEGSADLGEKFFNVDMDKKYCPDCEKIKPRNNFYFNKTRKHLDNLSSVCKECARRRGNAEYKRKKDSSVRL